MYVEVVEKGWGLPGSLETAKAFNEGWIASQVDKLNLKYFQEALGRISKK